MTDILCGEVLFLFVSIYPSLLDYLCLSYVNTKYLMHGIVYHVQLAVGDVSILYLSKQVHISEQTKGDDDAINDDYLS